MTEKPKKTRRKPLEPWQLDEAKRLKMIFENHPGKLTQDEFAARYGLGTQGLVWQYLNGIIPLNIEAAIKFARALNCKIEDFSPSLAAVLMPAISEGLIAERKGAYSMRKQRIIDGIASLDDSELDGVQGAAEIAKQLHDLRQSLISRPRRAGNGD